MKNTHIAFILVAVVGLLVLAACGSDSDDVASLRTLEDTQPVGPAADPTDTILNNEAMMMAFTECLRDQGIDVLDPVVDSEGNVEKPEFAEVVNLKGEDFGAAWDACAAHLEGFTFGEKRVDVSEQVDQFVALAACLRDKGYDVDDPTAETLDQWGTDFKTAINWDDPAAMTDYEECNADADGGAAENERSINACKQHTLQTTT